MGNIYNFEGKKIKRKKHCSGGGGETDRVEIYDLSERENCSELN